MRRVAGCRLGSWWLAAGGWTVYATARNVAALKDLEGQGCKTLALDVTDEASMRAAVEAVEGAEGSVGVLVNNAGYSQSGALESVPIDRIRLQFETNSTIVAAAGPNKAKPTPDNRVQSTFPR